MRLLLASTVALAACTGPPVHTADDLRSKDQRSSVEAQAVMSPVDAFIVETTTTVAVQIIPPARVERDPPAPRTEGMPDQDSEYFVPEGAGSVDWDAIAECESDGDWHINTGNSYYGGLQMNMSFWRSYGGLDFAERPDLASREQQIIVAENAYAVRGVTPWPTCGKYGL